MFGLRSLRGSERDRPFWLLAALAVVMLVGVSTTIANAASAPGLVDGLRRDLGAIRAQLERIDPEPGPAAREAGRQTIAFNADLGDGGPAFRHRSMATILRSANRRLTSLIAGYRKAGDERRAELAQKAQLDLQELYRAINDLGDAMEATSTMWDRKRALAEALLDQLHDMLPTLAPRHPGVG